jgi:hypothetical protein
MRWFRDAGLILALAAMLPLRAPAATAQVTAGAGRLPTPLLANQSFLQSAEEAAPLLDTPEVTRPGDSPPLSRSVLYAISGVPDLSPPWAHANDSGEIGLAPPVQEGRGVFLRSWMLLTGVEVALLATTMALPQNVTGWSHSSYIQDGVAHLKRAYTEPPAMDHDKWYTNYAGHPYGGSIYYNTVRAQGGSKTKSFLFATLMSTQWEYVFEAVAERPSIQDLIVTPVTGRILGEAINQMTHSMVRGGANLLDKVAITVLNPAYVVFNGYAPRGPADPSR